MSPVCTIMVGRLDDWLQVHADSLGVLLTPGVVNWAGIACVKRAYGIYHERGYRTRLLAAAYRNHLHWSQLIGGDIVLTIPYKWQLLFNASDIDVVPRFDDPVPADVLSRAPGEAARVPPRLRAGRPLARRVRHVRRDQADTARLHRLVPGPGGGRP